MEKPPGVVDFKVGQMAEFKTFEEGYRGAWFRCKILNIIPEENKIKLDYYDFEQEEPSWEQIYKEPPHGRKTKQIKKQLMLRPRYPPMYHKSEIPPAKSISEVCVVINGIWKVEDRVDWCYESAYWSARVIKLLSDVKVQIELPMPPAGEGKEYEADSKDLRPCLNWSPREGWTLPTVGGRTSGSAQLIFPSKQGTSLEVENAAGSPLNVSSSTRISAERDSEKQSNTGLEVENAAGSPINVSSSTRISAEGDSERQSNTGLEVENAAGSPINASSSTRISAEGDSERQSNTGLEVENAAGSPINVSSSTRISAEGDSERQNKDVKMDNSFIEGDMKKQSSDHVDTVICEEKVQSEDVQMDDLFAEGDTQKESSYPVDTVICEENVQSEDVEVDVEFAVRDTKKQNSDPVDAVIFQEKEQSEDVKMDDEIALADKIKQSSDPVHTVMEEKVQCEDLKMNDDDDVGSSDNTSSLLAEESKAAVDECDIDRRTNLNIMHEYTLEAAVTDLEELANKIKWIKAILNNNDNQSTTNHFPILEV